ncbi:MAG: 4-carboxy-4-hydroxy-2-oxoadipate aldolase/oxaloacetate decarboxylase [Chloroflexi bacterium]|nr:4-carboxy-4-hydroxy-2-oxoadipate aldolase/oxaloacetate decarboxylase [Chloroflexota bacterium]
MAIEISHDVYGALRDLGVATVYEAGGGTGAMDPAIKPVWPGARLCGPAFTVRCHPGDNLAIHRSLEFVSAGDVLVVQNGELLGGYWGGILTLAAQVRRVAGLVIDGGLRDSEEIQRVGFPAFARGTAVHRTVKHEPGELQVPLVIGGVQVQPGDVILGDGDGVMAVDRARAMEALEASRKRAAAEQAYVERIRRGELTMDIYGFPRPPDRHGA